MNKFFRRLSASGGASKGAKVPWLTMTVPVPAGFGWTPPVEVYYHPVDKYTTNYDKTPFLVEGNSGVTTYYVDSVNGHESNPGTQLLPKASLRTISLGRVNKLLIKARGKFIIGISGQAFTGHDNLCVEAWDGAECIITSEATAATPFTWTDEGGGVWSAPPPHTIFNGLAVYEGTEPDASNLYVSVSTLVECQATPGSNYRQTSPSIVHYIHTSTGASPASGHVMFGANGACTEFNAASYGYDQRLGFYGVSFIGGGAAFIVTGTSTFNKRVDLVDCELKFSSSVGLSSDGSTVIVSCDTRVGPTVVDGLSYSTVTGASDGGQVPKAVEIGVSAQFCGFASSGANQGSTSHFGGKVLRVNGTYSNNADDQVADVGEGTRAWNLGCTFGPKGISSTRAGYNAGNNSAVVQSWLDGCEFVGVTHGVRTASGGSVFYARMPAPSVDPASAGVLAPYLPSL